MSAQEALALLDVFARLLTGYCDRADGDTVSGVIPVIFPFAQSLGRTLLQGQQLAHTLNNIERADQVLEKCVACGDRAAAFFGHLQQAFDAAAVESNADRLRSSLKELDSFIAGVLDEIKGRDERDVGQDLQNELGAMERAIEEAAARMVALWDQSKHKHSGVKLEVNEKILDSCTALMKTIVVLINKAKVLQAEIVARGKGQFTLLVVCQSFDC